MKNSAACAKKFKALIRKQAAAEATPCDDGPTGELIYSSLLWNATSRQAGAAYKRMLRSVVDFNDLRHNHAAETIDLLGASYPLAAERAKRLRAMLRSIYLREHDVTLEVLATLSKAECRQYLETLAGVSPFVANRVLAICCDVAAMPVDDRARECLIAAGAADESVSVPDLAVWVTRQVKAADMVPTLAKLQKWVESQPKRRPARKKTPSRKKAPAGRRRAS